MIIISLSIISLAGIFLTTYSKSFSYNPKIEIIEARAISWSGGTLIKVNVANTGNVKITLTSISITGIGNVWSGQKNLEPSENYEIEYPNAPSQPIGKKLTIIVNSIDQNGKTIQAIKNVEVLP